MTAPVEIIGFPLGKTVQRFEMIQFEVKFDRAFFHLDQIGERNYHNAYDADENFTLFRADAIFEQDGEEHIVPIFAAQGIKMSHQKPFPKREEWRWYVRFRPHKSGTWRLRIRVLLWHPKKASGDPDKPLAGRYPGMSRDQTFYEHKFGFREEDYKKYKQDAERVFTVVDGKGLAGPLETPKQGDNLNYFYRWTNDGKTYKRRPFFLLGLARPWLNEKSVNFDPESPWSFHAHIDRGADLFKPMQKVGCNALLHWLAPWEGLLVHQSPCEYWPKPEPQKDGEHKFERFDRIQRSAIKQKGGRPVTKDKKEVDKTKLDGTDTELGYKMYDQGRALHLDRILDLARKYDILLFLAPLPHPLLRDCDHPWRGVHFGKGDEQGYKKEQCKDKKYWSPPCGGAPEKRKPPSQLNGFQLFRNDKGETISIEDFFSMDPESKEPWKRRLWKHYANFWHYLIGRWAAHPSLGAWVLVDEMDGVGSAEQEVKKEDGKGTEKQPWWWAKQDLTFKWHDHLVELLRGKLKWVKPDISDYWWEEEETYSKDYLSHPLTSSATDYEGSYWQNRRKILAKIRGIPEDKVDVKSVKPSEAMEMINRFGERKNHGDWRGNKEKIDFVSHHAYHYVPTWGQWKEGKYEGSKTFTDWHKVDNGNWSDENDGCKKKGALNINTDRWLWDSLCMRLRKWSEATATYNCPRLITEYGCWERGWEKNMPVEPYGKYGKRHPSYVHFANWAALMLGHAGVPFKWNDGKELGEMIGRTNKRKGNPFDPSVYPVDNYAEIKHIAKFIKGVDLGALQPSETSSVQIVEIAGGKERIVKEFNVWALVNVEKTFILAWLYDREFSQRSRQLSLKVRVSSKRKGSYNYVWFDTWSGNDLPGGNQAAVEGVLKIPLPPTLPRSEKKGGGDGSDIAIRITLRAGSGT